MPRIARPTDVAEHKPQNAMDDPEEIARFYDRCSDLMRQLLGVLAAAPDESRTFPVVEGVLAWRKALSRDACC